MLRATSSPALGSGGAVFRLRGRRVVVNDDGREVLCKEQVASVSATHPGNRLVHLILDLRHEVREEEQTAPGVARYPSDLRRLGVQVPVLHLPLG